MKCAQIFTCVLLFSSILNAKLDLSDFKSSSLPVTVPSVNPLAIFAIGGIGISGFVGYKEKNRQAELVKSLETSKERLDLNNSEVKKMNHYEAQQLGVVNYVHKEYLKSKTDENWSKYNDEQSKLFELQNTRELKEAVVDMYNELIQSLEIKIDSVDRTKKVSYAFGGFLASWGLWNLFFKK